MSPLRALRESLAQSPQTKEMSTQAGFALLVNRSESLVRAVESGRVLMSAKFARELSTRFGVTTDWLKKKEVTDGEMKTIQLNLMNIEWPDTLEVKVKRPKWFEPDPRRRLRKSMIMNVLNVMDELFKECSDEELRVTLDELREWTFSRLAKLVEREGSRDVSNAENSDGDVGPPPQG